MGIGRNIWQGVCVSRFNRWPCPSCKTGELLPEKNTFQKLETGSSKAEQNDPDWELHWIDERFSAMMECNKCQEVVVVSGSAKPIQFDDYNTHSGDPETIHVYEYTIKHIFPAPPIFPIHRKYPKTVVDELTKSFSNFWHDHAACANSIRRSVEAVMDEQGMKKTKENGGPVMLDSKITEFKEGNPEAAELLLGLKWLGNYGSHVAAEPHSKDDLLDGYEVLEHVLSKIYIKNDERIHEIAQRFAAERGKPK